MLIERTLLKLQSYAYSLTSVNPTPKPHNTKTKRIPMRSLSIQFSKKEDADNDQKPDKKPEKDAKGAKKTGKKKDKK